MTTHAPPPTPEDSYVGVSRTSDGRFGAVLRHGGQSHYAGVWKTRAEAALARDRAILHFGLEDERGLNLPARARRLGAASPAALRREAQIAHRKASGKSSAYFGVTWNGKKWTARVSTPTKTHIVSHFDSARDAALAYDRMALFYLGPEAVLNFPDTATKASVQEIRRETRPRKAEQTSQYRGVYWDSARGLWAARFHHREKTQTLGRFARERDAARAYDYAAWAALKDKARLNFATPPDEPPEPVRKRATPGPKRSAYQGVSPHGGSFAAFLVLNGDTLHLGRWPKERSAAVAHDRAVLHFGLEKELNFPERSRRLGPEAPQFLRNQARLEQRKQLGKTRYIGVTQSLGRRRFQVKIADGEGVTHFLGAFPDEKRAALAYDRVAMYLHGGAVARNFPRQPVEPATPEAMRAEAYQLFKEETTSQYRGVSATRSGRWTAGIMAQWQGHHLGTFDVEEEAAEAYDRAARRLHKQRAKTNFEG